jgi:hypothetical protein
MIDHFKIIKTENFGLPNSHISKSNLDVKEAAFSIRLKQWAFILS